MSRDRKKRRLWLWVCIVVMVLFGGVILWLTREPANRPVTVSPETTILTGPLRPDGTVDYVAAINQIYGKGVTKENNAAVLLVRAFGPKFLEYYPDQSRIKVLELLEIGPLPDKGDYFVTFDDYVEAHPPSVPATKPSSPPTTQPTSFPGGFSRHGPGGEPGGYSHPPSPPPPPKPWELARNELDKAMSEPWSAKDLPTIAGWLKANEKPLALMIKASERTRYYFPYVGDSEQPIMNSVMIPGLRGYRSCAKALAARAMLKCNKGQIDAAWRDLLAAHRLAILTGQGQTIVERLVSISMAAVSNEATRVLACSGRLSAAQARRILADLQSLSPLPHPVDAIDRCERFMLLDIISLCSVYGTRRTLGDNLEHNDIPNVSADWDEILREANRWNDRQVDAINQATFADRQAALETFSREFESHFGNGTRSGVSKLINEIKDWLDIESDKSGLAMELRRDPAKAIIGNLLPRLTRCSVMYDQLVMQQRLTQVALALAAYKAQRGKFPDKLSQLSPAYLKSIPLDLFVEKPLHYRRVGAGYILYSVGDNMNDDGGKTREESRAELSGTDTSDIVVKVK